MNGIDEYKKMLDTALAVGLPIIGKWTAARICFITYYWGGSREEFTYSPKLHAELEHIQKKYGIEGTSCPDVEIIDYIKQLEAEQLEYEKQFNDSYLAADKIPQWANDLCKERYGFSLTNVSSSKINK